MTDEQMLAWAQKPENAQKPLAKMVMQKLGAQVGADVKKPKAIDTPTPTPADREYYDPEASMSDISKAAMEKNPDAHREMLLRTAAGFIPGGMAVQGAANTVAGIASRAMSQDPNKKAFGLRSMAQDFVLGAGPAAILHGAGVAGESAAAQAAARGMETPALLAEKAPLNAVNNTDLQAITEGGRLGGTPGSDHAGWVRAETAFNDLNKAKDISRQPLGWQDVAEGAGVNPAGTNNMLSGKAMGELYDPSTTLLPAASARSAQLDNAFIAQPGMAARASGLKSKIGDYLRYISDPRSAIVDFAKSGFDSSPVKPPIGAYPTGNSNASLLRYLSAASEANKRGLPITPELKSAISSYPGQTMTPQGLNALRSGAQSLMDNPDDPYRRGQQ